MVCRILFRLALAYAIARSPAKNSCRNAWAHLRRLLRELAVTMNGSGPNTEPRGIPQARCIFSEVVLFTLIFAPRVSEHLSPLVNRRSPPPFVSAPLNRLLQVRRLWGREIRFHTPSLWDCSLVRHPDASCYRVVECSHAPDRTLHPSEDEPAGQFPKCAPPRLVPRVKCARGFGGSSRARAGCRERIEREPEMATVLVRRGRPVRHLAASKKRDVR
ncbi:hypothetical protein TRVL_07511 [Trypanosoma vivax]|nr:hypothetical protein TRVL_07511 [Trypanosoma vivax]